MSLILLMNYSNGQTGGLQNEETRILKMLCCPDGGGSINNLQYEQIWHWNVDTLIPTPDTTLRKLLIAGEERNNLKKQVRNLEEQVNLLNEVIKEHDGKDVVQTEYFSNQMKNLQDQIALCKEQVVAFEKMVKMERRKRRLITGAGILTTAGAILLSLKK